MRLLVTSLIQWWCHQSEEDFASFLAEDFAYDVGLELNNREEFLLIRAGSGGFEDVELIDLHCYEGGAAVMFESTDCVTRLRQRGCWMITLDAGKIKRIVACAGNVLM